MKEKTMMLKIIELTMISNRGRIFAELSTGEFYIWKEEKKMLIHKKLILITRDLKKDKSKTNIN